MNYSQQKLQELDIILPIPPRAVGNYSPWIRTGNLIYTSGQFPWKNGMYGTLTHTGRVGKGGLTVEEGYECARLAAICAIAQLNAAVGGDLDLIKRIVRLDGNVQAAEGFGQHSEVLNGASDIINHVFGNRGLHTRSASGVFQTPLNTPVLLYVIAEV